jgi:hypothetical protein
MRKDFPSGFPIPKRIGGNAEILRGVSDFHEVAKLVHDGLQSKKIALDAQTLPKMRQLANQETCERISQPIVHGFIPFRNCSLHQSACYVFMMSWRL